MTIIPPEKLGVYLREAEKYGVLPMFFLELSSGLRRGELLALLWDDLNVKDRILSVSKQVTRIDGELVITEPKTKNSVRRVALSQQAVDILVREHEQHPDNPSCSHRPHRRLLESGRGVQDQPQAAGNGRFEEHVRFHDLRHPYVKHTTKKYNSEKQKTQATKIVDLIAWGFCFCIVSYSKRSWTL